MMNTILLKSVQMPFHTDMKVVFKALKDKQKDYNWLLTNIDCNYYPDKRLLLNNLLISGEELTDIIYKNDIQFMWGVFSGFNKDINIDFENLEVIPFADGNSKLWEENPKIQHPLAAVEIVCFDSSCTLLLSKDDELTELFRSYFKEAIDLNDYNKS